MTLQNIRTYKIQYIPNMYIMHKVVCRNLKRFTELSLRLNAAILLHVTMDDVREFHMWTDLLQKLLRNLYNFLKVLFSI